MPDIETEVCTKKNVFLVSHMVPILKKKANGAYRPLP